ncbi:Rha family transcriptional regulator [Bacteroides finegoldii]|mgnify:FL=1|jgi:phage regulator Rha-like protein|uniref:Rha family transcriptional regulator n=2 Tax=Bacteroides finegoldii TaxID=338188 RepID=UPI00234C1F37|nr:Rha family transcriptional regulator [Bacteroides finegoldii]MDC7141905.1 Rha family transcriptional regulator [Bacteroides finegoldii]
MKIRIIKNTELKNEPSAHKRTMSSVDIAEMTGKRHSDVMRSIRAMELTWIKISERKFASASYKDEQGKPRPMYLLDYRECMYIATKFNDEARAKLILRWDELEKEDRAKESNALPDPTDSGAAHTIHELIEWVGALQRLGGADKALTLELMKKIAEEKGLPMVDIPVSTENTPAEKRPCIEKLTPSPAKEKDKCKIVRKAYTLTDLLKIHGKKYTAAQFNQLLIEKGFMEIRYKNGEPYKAIALKGLKYGVNSTRIDYPDTLLPVWYSDTFPRLVELIEEPDPF